MKKRVLIAMSGGVDSSVAALMLLEKGYELIGITMKTWDYATSGGTQKETGCCSLESINDARDLAVKLAFPHYTIDIRKEFENHVVKNFVDEYMAGRTPNPCILCNTHIKWDALLEKADGLNCDYIATGHYAQISLKNERYCLAKGIDEVKDQSYVLWGLSQQNLARTLMPLGCFHKSQIKQYAEKKGFNALAKKKESYEICFVPDNDYRSFLKRKIANIDDEIGEGDFVSITGEKLGTHKGYPFYTIGQRKGLDVAVGYPLFVTEIKPETNTIVLGTRDELSKTVMWVKNYNLVKYDKVPENFEVITKIRYKDKGTVSRINEINGMIKVDFWDTVSAIAPGQSAVFYEGDEVVGGGFIV